MKEFIFRKKDFDKKEFDKKEFEVSLKRIDEYTRRLKSK
jgi:hypothetical protein